MHITVKHNVMAAHFWPGAPANRTYLAFPHVHSFQIEVDILVEDPDRGVEFHDAQQYLGMAVNQLIDTISREQPNLWGDTISREQPNLWGDILSFGSLSCEQIGILLMAQMLQTYPVSKVRVSEDGINYSEVSQKDLMLMSMQNIAEGEFGFQIDVSYRQIATNRNVLSCIPTGFAEGFTLKSRPPVVTICGSTKFKDETLQAIAMMEDRKHMCLSVGYFAHAEQIQLDEKEKIQLDELHKWKIIHSDYIFVVNPGGYIGSSTRSEIEFAIAHGIPIEYLVEPDTAPSPDEFRLTNEQVESVTVEELNSRLLYMLPTPIFDHLRQPKNISLEDFENDPPQNF